MEERSSPKAANLQRLKENGFPVPGFFVLYESQTNEQLKPVKDRLRILSDQLREADNKQLKALSDAIFELITSVQFSAHFLNSIKQKCAEQFGNDWKVAVRSSALNEDVEDASFAGQMDTFLMVDETELEAKIKACLASAYSAPAIQYRLLKGFDPAEGQMDIIIQEMVIAERSGVIFTMNPNGNLNDTAIIVGKGAGEGVVTGKTATDHFFIDRSDKAIKQELTSEKPLLVSGKLEALFEYGQRSEKVFGRPQDLEFSIDKNEKIWLLQSRPITGIDWDELKILDNSNIVESYPHITLPLSFSFARNGYEQVFRGCAKPFGLSDTDLKLQKEALSNLITHLNGRVYYRLDNWYRIMSLVLSSEKQLQEWENNLGIRLSETKKVRIGYRRKLRSVWILLKLLMTYRQKNRKFYREFNEIYRELREQPAADWPAKKLFEFYRQRAHILFRAWAPTQINDFIAFRAFNMMQKLLEKLGFKPEDNIANDLMCGMKEVESEAPMLKLLEMKAMIEDNEALQNLFLKKQPAEVLSQLKQPEYASFLLHFEFYLDKYGDRTLEELKLETPSLRQAPEKLVKRLQQHLETDLSVEDFKHRQRQIREQAEEKLNTRIKRYHPKRWLLDLLINMSRYGLRNRENMRFARTRSYGAVKEIFLLIANQMVRDKIVDEKIDIFYLDHKDVEDYCMDFLKTDLRRKVSEGKELYTQYGSVEMPNRVIYAGDEPPFFKGAVMPIENDQRRFCGIPVSRGKVEGAALVLLHPDQEVDVKNKILVTKMTDPGWIFLMSRAAGLISEKGSLLSHTAIVGRELGLPTIVGIEHATQLFKSGDILTMDGASGIVNVNSPKEQEI